MKSPFQQYVHHPDGSITIDGMPDVNVHVIQEQGRVTRRDIERELCMPKYYEQWEAWDNSEVPSRRMVRFVLMDESVTRLQGNPRLQPRKIMLPPTSLAYLEFGHHGFSVGVVFAWYLGFKENLDDLTSMGIDVPSHVEGEFILCDARLTMSALAQKAWEALQRGVFTHVCPVIHFRENIDPIGTGQLVEVSLVNGDYPGCPGARVLKFWEE